MLGLITTRDHKRERVRGTRRDVNATREEVQAPPGGASSLPTTTTMASRTLVKRSQQMLRARVLSTTSFRRGIPGTGNPTIVNRLPNTSKEVNVSENVVSASNELETQSSTNGTNHFSTLPGHADAHIASSSSSVDGRTDWSKSYHGLSAEPFPKEAAAVLQAPIDPMDIEMKPGALVALIKRYPTYRLSDGLIYLPEIKYRRILNKAFGPGGWGLAPRSETNVSPKIVSREYALVCLGRCVILFTSG